jgi:hypothetical protein
MGISLASLPSFLFSYHSLTTIQTGYFLDLTELQTHKLATSHLNKQQDKEKKQRQTTDRPQLMWNAYGYYIKQYLIHHIPLPNLRKTILLSACVMILKLQRQKEATNGHLQHDVKFK